MSEEEKEASKRRLAFRKAAFEAYFENMDFMDGKCLFCDETFLPRSALGTGLRRIHYLVRHPVEIMKFVESWKELNDTSDSQYTALIPVSPPPFSSIPTCEDPEQPCSSSSLPARDARPNVGIVLDVDMLEAKDPPSSSDQPPVLKKRKFE